MSFTRLTIGPSELSPDHYSFDDMPAGEADSALSRCSIAPNADTVLPVVNRRYAPTRGW